MEQEMRATVVFNPKYGKYDGIHAGKVVSRCATMMKVVEYFKSRGFSFTDIDLTAAYAVPPAMVVAARTQVKATNRTANVPKFSTQPALHAQLKNEVREVCERARKLFGPEVIGSPEVKFFSRGTTAGRAHYRDMSVSLNDIIARDNPTKFSNTVSHEVAHLVVKKLYPLAKPHGYEFKRVHRALGGTGATCHSMDASNAKVTRSYTYGVITCGCVGKEHLVSPQRAKRAANLRCRKCGSYCTNTGRTITK
jgi:predicted SprT family Zn-dependent metalloprotease